MVSNSTMARRITPPDSDTAAKRWPSGEKRSWPICSRRVKSSTGGGVCAKAAAPSQVDAAASRKAYPIFNASPSSLPRKFSPGHAWASPALHDERERAGHHAPERGPDAPQREPAQRDEEGDERRLAGGIVLERHGESAAD